MMDEAILYALVELKATLQKQNELQQKTLIALGSLTKVLLHTASSINILNSELTHDAEEATLTRTSGTGATN
jgi:hypothetical protein